MSEDLALFAYGSLASVPSAQATLGRPLERAAVVQLSGWRRRWSQTRDNQAVEKTFADSATGAVPMHCLGLNIERVPEDERKREKPRRPLGTGAADIERDAPGGGPNGALFAVSEVELDRLDMREMRYRRIEVTEGMPPDAGALGFAKVVSFTARPENFAPTPPPGAVILAPYLRAVEAAFASMGRDQLDLFRETTGEVPVEVIEAVLVRDEIPPGNPRDW